jgi:hypothetical protein
MSLRTWLNTCSEGSCHGVFPPFQAQGATWGKRGALRRVSAGRERAALAGVRCCPPRERWRHHVQGPVRTAA